MPTRTRLTTPGGAPPPDDVPVERWVRGPGIPVEPTYPPRRRRFVLAGAVGLLVGAVVTVAVVLVERPASQDPPVDAPGVEQPAGDAGPNGVGPSDG